MMLCTDFLTLLGEVIRDLVHIFSWETPVYQTLKVNFYRKIKINVLTFRGKIPNAL